MSTQILTELPNIQKAGMDFETVINELHSIINNNPNWKQNWSGFADSEAGTMLIQIMAWIADNLATRQDIINNEMFLGTARKAVNKIRHLKHIGYVPQMPHAAKTPVVLAFEKLVDTNIYITPPRDRDLLLRKNQICSFDGKDINGKNIKWELIKITDGKPDYLNSIMIGPDEIEYKKDKQGNDLYALQGRTQYEEFTTSTNDGPFFNLREKNIAADSLQVYLKKDASRLIEVSSFVSKDALDESLAVPYVLELNEDMTYRIRFGNRGILAKERLLPAGTTISVFYRVTDGMVGNIPPEFINKSYEFTGENGKTYKATIKNTSLGFGGTDQETLDQAVLNGPLSLRTMDRAVTPEDYNIILGRNTNIFKVKTYTSSNQPAGFRDYYGRYINPQESFSFVMFNKTYKGVPTSKYNYFPWISTSKEPRLNEKYVFDHGSYNTGVELSDTLYNVKVSEANGVGERTFKNFTVLNLGEDWNSSLYNEDGKLNTYLKAKICIDPTDEKFYDDIAFTLLGPDNYDSIGTIDSIGRDIRYFSQDDHARFISKGAFDLSKPVDVIEARYLNVIVNGILDQPINLWGGTNFHEDDMPEHAYLLWSNTPKEGIKPIDFANLPTTKAAEYRYGIIEIMNMSLNSAVIEGDKIGELSKVSRQYYGLDSVTTDKESVFPNIEMSDIVKLCVNIKGVTYVFKLSREYYENNTRDFGMGPDKPAWGSLRALANYLTYVFENGKSSTDIGFEVKKMVSPYKLEEIEPDELVGYRADAIKRVIFDSDYSYDDDQSFSSARQLWDLVISNYSSSTKELTTITFQDKYNVQHKLNNVIDVEDPDKAKTVEGNRYETLGSIMRGLSCNRRNGTIPNPTQAAEYNDLVSIKQEVKFDENGNIVPGYEDKVGYGRLKIASPTIGESSTICFKRRDSGIDKNKDSDFGEKVLGLKYPNDGYSEKAYGTRKLYLLDKDALSVTKTENGVMSNINIPVKAGNVIFENSCIYNNSDFENLYVNYKIKKNNSLRLGSVYNNYYYTGDSTDELLKEDVSGVTGQYVDYEEGDDGNRKYKINREKSNLDIRFTTELQKTNSLYPIVSDLDVIKSERVKITTDTLAHFDSVNAKFIFKIDKEPDIVINMRDCNNTFDIYNSIEQSIKENGSFLVKDNKNVIISQSYLDASKLIFQSLDSNEGLIVFKVDEDASDEVMNKMYKSLLGTSLTNSSFYKTYPKKCVKDANIVEITKDEYYYVPRKEMPLGFNFRKLINTPEGLESRDPDYYIDIVEYPMGDQYRYDFKIVKTENSRFPDREFYMHFINDKTYQFDEFGKKKENDETVLQNYMYKYKISGTDMTFYQPYFRTYDIAANIKYNSNFSETEVVQAVRKAIDEVCDLKAAEIAGSMSQAKIFKAIMNCDGVTDCKIRYFGEDYSSKKGNVDTLTADFYEILCLHEDQGEEHGKVLTFEVAN